MAHPENYYVEATRLRMEALTVRDPDQRMTLLQIARLNERLAETVEKRQRDAG